MPQSAPSRGLGCGLPVERFNQAEKLLLGRRLRIGGMNMSKMQSLRLGLVFLMLLAVLCIANTVWGQDVTAAITGTVMDPSGAGLAGAPGRAAETDRGPVCTAHSNDA